MTVAPLSWKKRLFFSLFPFLALGVLALAAEGILRLAAPGLDQSYFAKPDPETGLGYTGGHPFRYNKWRMREVDFPAERPEGETRYLCLGDSITFGYGLAAESSWPKVLQKNVQQESPDRSVFCINAAGTGATTHRQLAFYQNLGRTFGAKAVIVGFCMNDVVTQGVMSDLEYARPGRVAKSFEWRSKLRRSYLFAAVDLTLTETVKRYIWPMIGKNWINAYPYQVNSLGMTPVSGQAWKDTLASLEKLHASVTADGSDFVLAIFPYQFQISDDRRDNPYRVDKSRFTIDPFQKLAEECRRLNMTCVDLREVFHRKRQAMIDGEIPWDPLYIDFCHPNETGQALAAAAIQAKLVPRGAD